MKIKLATAFYCVVMLLQSGLNISTIFAPFLLLWIFCLMVGGPILCFASLNLLAHAVSRRAWRPAKLLPPLICLVLVSVWSLGLFRIHGLLTPLVFAWVAKDDERLAVSFMQQNPPDTDVEVSGFRYPYFKFSPSGSTVQHHAGVVSIRVPAGPGNLDFLVYVSPGSSLPYAPRDEDTREGFEVKSLAKNWYYVHAVGI